MKFNLYKSVATCALMVLATGCHDFEELNTNPYAPIYDPTMGEVSADGIDIDYKLTPSAIQSLRSIEGALGQTFANFTYEGPYNDYQITTNLTHDIYAGYWGNNVSGFVQNSPTYSYNDGWSAARWRHFYDDRTVGEYSQIIKICHFVNPKYYHTIYNITRIYYAFLLSMQTDTYGDVPVKYYIKGALPPVTGAVYSKQEEVYDYLFKVLDQAITNLRPENIPATQQFLLADNDKCFKGDVDKWRRFANTLRLRLALRVSNVNPQLAQAQATAAFDEANGGLMKSNEDNMKQTPKRQYIAGGNENIFALLFNWGANVVLTKEMEWAYKNQSFAGGVEPTDKSQWEAKSEKNSELRFNNKSENCILDPRCEILWFRPTEFDKLNKALPEESTKDFNGVRNGVSTLGQSQTKVYSPNRCSTTSDYMNPEIWWNYAREIVWMGYAEALFLQAEANLRWGLGDEDVQNLYKKGVEASMNYYGILPAKYTNYINNLVALHNWSNLSDEEKLEAIITQKWIAVFPNGNEGWAEVRRTNYPRYILTPEGGNNSGSEIANEQLISRVKYPNSEGSINSANMPKDNSQNTRVWWDTDYTMNNNGKWIQPNNFK